MIELLVVIMIMLMVTAAAIPVVAPAMQNRRMREAARTVSSVFAGTRSRAIENGRPYGVMIERSNGLDFAMMLSYVEVPLPYTGDFASSRATVRSDGSSFSFVSGDTEWKGLLRQGDLVRMDYGGVLYKLQAGITDGQIITAVPPWSLAATSSTTGEPAAWFTGALLVAASDQGGTAVMICPSVMPAWSLYSTPP